MATRRWSRNSASHDISTRAEVKEGQVKRAQGKEGTESALDFCQAAHSSNAEAQFLRSRRHNTKSTATPLSSRGFS
jgi:hypothetical protein